jgi:hypothetical protein
LRNGLKPQNGIGCTWPGRKEFDYYPNRYSPKTKKEGYQMTLVLILYIAVSAFLYFQVFSFALFLLSLLVSYNQMSLEESWNEYIDAQGGHYTHCDYVLFAIGIIFIFLVLSNILIFGCGKR